MDRQESVQELLTCVVEGWGAKEDTGEARDEWLQDWNSIQVWEDKREKEVGKEECIEAQNCERAHNLQGQGYCPELRTKEEISFALLWDSPESTLLLLCGNRTTQEFWGQSGAWNGACSLWFLIGGFEQGDHSSLMIKKGFFDLSLCCIFLSSFLAMKNSPDCPCLGCPRWGRKEDVAQHEEREGLSLYFRSALFSLLLPYWGTCCSLTC